jgi:transcriptional regulator with XRE-family HTH domain
MTAAQLLGARPRSAGDLLRAWRTKRRLSQMELALRAGVSPRHLSCVENGRSRASAELLAALAEVLELPLREANALLLAGGHAPRHPQTDLGAPDMAAMREALTRVLDAHDPYPGVALDGRWNVVIANAAARRLIAALPPEVLAPVPNLFRAALHPRGMAAFTRNFDEWGRYLLRELQRLADASLDEALWALRDEVQGYDNVRALRQRSAAEPPSHDLLVPCMLDLHGRRLALFTTLATFGSPRDVTLAELTVELFYPADAATAQALRATPGP